MLRSIRVAVGFLTVLPLSPRQFREDDLGNSVRFFPLVGAIYAVLTWGLLNLLTRVLSPWVASWLTVFALAALNGWIHWDGFADTADGMGAREPQKRLAIMKDSRLGAFGVIALAFLIIGKVVLLVNLMGLNFLSFLPVFVLSRWVMAMQIYTQPSVSQGLLKAFRISHRNLNIIVNSGLMLIAVWFGRPVSFALLGASYLTFLGMSRMAAKRLGGITGDILGASNELTEIVCLLILSIGRV